MGGYIYIYVKFKTVTEIRWSSAHDTFMAESNWSCNVALTWVEGSESSLITETILGSSPIGVEDGILQSVRTFGLDALCVVFNGHSVVFLLKQVVAFFSVTVSAGWNMVSFITHCRYILHETKPFSQCCNHKHSLLRHTVITCYKTIQSVQYS